MKRSKHSLTQCYNNFFLKWTQCFSREFRGSRSIYDFPTYSTRCCLLLRLFLFRSEANAKAKREWHAQDTRMTSDEAQGALGRRKMRGEALPRPHSPSRLPLRGNFHKGRRRLGVWGRHKTLVRYFNERSTCDQEETFSLNGVTSENKQPTPLPLPSIQSSCLPCFLQVAGTAEQHGGG